MKIIRNLVTLAGLTMVVFALGATGVRAQTLSTTELAGKFTLHNDAQWGAMTLPAGKYELRYGKLSGSNFVTVRGTSKGSPRGWIRVRGTEQSSNGRNALVCVREGDFLIVRTLEMPIIGKTAEFSMPHGVTLMARNGKHSEYTQLAEAPMLIQRIPVALNAK